MVLKMLFGHFKMFRRNKSKIFNCLILLLVYGVTYVHWDSGCDTPTFRAFYERYNYSLIPLIVVDFGNKIGWMTSDVFWYLKEEGPKDSAVIVWFVGVAFVMCFALFTKYSGLVKNLVALAFVLSMLGWLCYCFWQ